MLPRMTAGAHSQNSSFLESHVLPDSDVSCIGLTVSQLCFVFGMGCTVYGALYFLIIMNISTVLIVTVAVDLQGKFQGSKLLRDQLYRVTMLCLSKGNVYGTEY